MDLRVEDVRLFVEVVDAESFSKAGRRLGVPRPSVSRRIAALEAKLGVRLLWRTTRRMRPTDVGRDFYERCRHVLASLEEAERVVAEAASTPFGVLRIAAPPIVGPIVLGDVVQRYMSAYPAVRVEMFVVDGHVRGCDLAVELGSAVDESLVSRLVGNLEYWLYAAPSYLASAPALVRPDDLAAHRVLLHAGIDDAPSLSVSSGSRTVDVKLRPAMSSNDYGLLRAAALDGQGVALLPAPMCTGAVEQGALQLVLPKWGVSSDPVRVVYRGGPLMPPKLAALLDLLDDHLATVELPCLRKKTPPRRRQRTVSP